MSEFQLYQFRAIDRHLTETQMARLSTLSSRVKLSPTSATFEYSYGNFPGDELELMTYYFDAMFYFASWGTKRLMFRFPGEWIAESELSPYSAEHEDIEDSLSFYSNDDVIIMDLEIREEECYDWLEEEICQLNAIVSLRDDIIRGDYRMLFLAWLKVMEIEIMDHADELEGLENMLIPPIPANLHNLNAALKSFIDCLIIDPDHIHWAAAKSRQMDEAGIDYRAQLSRLSPAEKDDFLLRLLRGEPRLDLKLLQRLRAK